MITGPVAPNLPISAAGRSLLEAIKAHDPDEQDWQWLKEPSVVEILNEKGTPQGFIFPQMEYKSDVAPCNTNGTESAALEAALVEGFDATAARDLRVDLETGLSVLGEKKCLFVSTRSGGNEDWELNRFVWLLS